MELVAYRSVQSFLHENGEFLDAAEAENNSFLGAVGALAREGTAIRDTAYLASVRGEGGLIVLNALSPGRGNLVFSDARSGQRKAAVSMIAADLAARELRPPGVFGQQELVHEFVEAWATLTRCIRRPLLTQTLYVLRTLISSRRVPGGLRLAVESDLDLVAEWSRAFLREALGKEDAAAARRSAEARIASREFFLWEHERPVSLAGCARATRHGIAINHVYTPPSDRRKGYATACVAQLTCRLLADGYSFCVLYADVANAESNSIYTRLGYEPVDRFQVFELGYPVQ